MKVSVFLSLICFMLFSCEKKHDIVNDCISQIVQETRDEIENSYNAQNSSMGMSALHGVKGFTMYFNLFESPRLEESRRIIVHSTNVLLNQINSNLSIRPYLVEYPFSNSRVSIAFWVKDKNVHPIKEPGVINSFSIHKGVIQYKTIEPGTIYQRDDKEVVIHLETFEEANRIIEDEKIKQERS